MRKGKITRDQVAARLAFVEDELASLTTLPELYRAFERKFRTARRTAERYVRRVHERWEAEGEATRATKRREIERAADVVFRSALRTKDHRAANGVLDLKAKLHGLYRPDADDASGSVDVVFECEPTPPDRVSAPADVAPGGDPPRR